MNCAHLELAGRSVFYKEKKNETQLFVRKKKREKSNLQYTYFVYGYNSITVHNYTKQTVRIIIELPRDENILLEVKKNRERGRENAAYDS